tara:strand:- start:696 stop:971 length:276 start_codon:yes stop_codon:yes gene_type:complete
MQTKFALRLTPGYNGNLCHVYPPLIPVSTTINNTELPINLGDLTLLREVTLALESDAHSDTEFPRCLQSADGPIGFDLPDDELIEIKQLHM